MNILVLQRQDVIEEKGDLIRSRLTGLGASSVWFASNPEEASQRAGASIVIAPTVPWLPAALSTQSEVRWIHFLSAGVDSIWAMDFDKDQYLLSKSSGVHAATITEFVLGAILYVLKSFETFSRQQRARIWNRFWLDECQGKTLGILGVGAIGKRLALQAGGLGMRVVGMATSDRPIDGVDEVYGPEGLHDVLAQSDFVVVLLPLTNRTQRVINAAALKSIKSSAWLINVARGEVIDEDALIIALKTQQIGGAVLDVFEEEPLSTASPLWSLDNVLLTPHVAGTTQHYISRALDIFEANFREYQAGRPLITPVDIERRY